MLTNIATTKYLLYRRRSFKKNNEGSGVPISTASTYIIKLEDVESLKIGNMVETYGRSRLVVNHSGLTANNYVLYQEREDDERD